MTFLDYIKEVLEELEQDKEKTLDDYIKELPEDELITLFECYIKTCAGKGDYEKYITFIKSLYEIK